MSAGGRWALMRRQDIHEIDGWERLYLRRWRLLETPLFGVFLHAIWQSDGDRHLHDHPWSFCSIVLRGGYIEELEAARFSYRRAGSCHLMRHGRFHAIRCLLRHPTWTLVFVGRRRSDWGYLTEDGFVEGDEYHRRIKERTE